MNIHPASNTNIQKAADLLRHGKLVAFATETVYGLGADATNGLAVADIFTTKGRPHFNPLIIHVHSRAMAEKYVHWNDFADRLQCFMPGALTLILPRLPGSSISLLASAGGDTIGIRMPAHTTAMRLIEEAGLPLAAPSANRSGRISPTTAQAVYAELGNAVPMILDGGECSVGIESTVLDITGEIPVLLRPGIITLKELENALQVNVSYAESSSKIFKSPGLLASHYAPFLPVRINVDAIEKNEVLIAFGPQPLAHAEKTINLSETSDLKEAAANLFAALRMLDQPRYSGIAVMPIPVEGIGMAINDRLQRAACKEKS